jgi:carbamoylphosphate synthase small subunit
MWQLVELQETRVVFALCLEGQITSRGPKHERHKIERGRPTTRATMTAITGESTRVTTKKHARAAANRSLVKEILVMSVSHRQRRNLADEGLQQREQLVGKRCHHEHKFAQPPALTHCSKTDTSQEEPVRFLE